MCNLSCSGYPENTYPDLIRPRIGGCGVTSSRVPETGGQTVVRQRFIVGKQDVGAVLVLTLFKKTTSGQRSGSDGDDRHDVRASGAKSTWYGFALCLPHAGMIIAGNGVCHARGDLYLVSGGGRIFRMREKG